jgi:hypothetical protein
VLNGAKIPNNQHWVFRNDYFLKFMNSTESLKIPKGKSEYLYRRRTDNTMAKRKKVQKDKQRSTKHTHNTKDRVTRTPLEVKSGVPEE